MFRDDPIIEQIESNGFYGTEPEHVRCHCCGEMVDGLNSSWYENSSTGEILCDECMEERMFNYAKTKPDFNEDDWTEDQYFILDELGFEITYDY